MSENVIWLNAPPEAHEKARRKDRNVALVESAFQFVCGHPFTDGDADDCKVGMTLSDAELIGDVLKVALKITRLGPAEFEAGASKDMAYFEHWLQHYETQIARFIERESADPLPDDWA